MAMNPLLIILHSPMAIQYLALYFKFHTMVTSICPPFTDAILSFCLRYCYTLMSVIVPILLFVYLRMLSGVIYTCMHGHVPYICSYYLPSQLEPRLECRYKSS